MTDHYQVLIVGGGTAGLTVAARLANSGRVGSIGLVEPSDKHYYQPIWTLVGGGVFPKEVSERNEADYIPHGVDWVQDRVESFDPDNNSVTTAGSGDITYDYLVVAAGIQLDWGKIPGLKESVGKPGTGVCSNYSYATVSSTWENIKALKGGKALFTQPSTGIKCAGAPQKICYLASHHWQKSGLGSQIDVHFYSGTEGIFAVKIYADTLYQVIDRYGISAHFQHELTALDPDNRQATFKNLATGEEVTSDYDMIHVTPLQSAPDFIKNSPLAADTGWVEVDQATTQHVRYDNVFALGDCSNLATSKTGAAIRKQAPTTTENLLAKIEGKELPGRYNGYTSCPLVTGYGSLVLAEFDYQKTPQESFPFDQSKERYSMYALKAYGLPRIYWNGMLQGRDF
ncbi:MAG TPA: NAD(P)/FAD-dependent oxidoreductase [Anaerolineae bacterium]|nr:NAD(P)/FAD-dependent oxidoreductase [Anaerolineae bacterium]